MSIIFVHIVQISECSLKLNKKYMLLFLHSFILSNIYEAEKLCQFSVSLSVDTTKMIYLCPIYYDFQLDTCRLAELDLESFVRLSDLNMKNWSDEMC